MAFKEIRFPDLYNLDVQFTRERKSNDVVALSGDIYANPQWAYSRRTGRMSWGPKTLEGIQEFINFFEVVTTVDTWRIKDAQDYNSGLPGSSVAADDQIIAVGDGAETVFQLVKAYSYGGFTHFQPVYAPVDGTVRIALDGVEVFSPATWSLDYSTGLLTFASAPGNGVVVTAGYEYDLKCRFTESLFTQSYLVQDFARIDSFGIVENPRT